LFAVRSGLAFREEGHETKRFVAFLVGAAGALPLAAFAQGLGKLWRIGFLAGGSRPASLDASAYAGFLRGMPELGHVEGKDFSIEWRFAEGKYDLFPALATEFVRIPADVIVVGTPAAVKSVQQATSTIPIVMGTSTDPVAAGLVASLAHPGGNTTGLASSQEDICLEHDCVTLKRIQHWRDNWRILVVRSF